MKRNEKLITVLNSLLTDELTAINQYQIQSEIDENQGYGKLLQAIRKQELDETLQAERLIEQFIFQGGAPAVSYLNPMKMGETVLETIKNDKGDDCDKSLSTAYSDNN